MKVGMYWKDKKEWQLRTNLYVSPGNSFVQMYPAGSLAMILVVYILYTDKKEKKILIYKKFRMDREQSHI
jgi:hypothetical protein